MKSILSAVLALAYIITPVTPASASYAASVSVSNATYVPWHISGGPTVSQTVTFTTPEPVPHGGYLLRIGLPPGMQTVVEHMKADPIDTGLGHYNYCYLDSMTCTVAGTGTITIVYGSGWGLAAYPVGNHQVTASLDGLGASGSGTLTFAPRSNLTVHTDRFNQPSRFMVESLGPSRTGPSTVTASGFTKQEDVGYLSPDCGWQGLNVVCQVPDLWPTLQTNDICIAAPGPSGQIYCVWRMFQLTRDVRVTVKVKGPYADPDTSNNSYSFGTIPASTGGSNGNSGGQQSVPTASPAASELPSPSVAPSLSDSPSPSASPAVAQLPANRARSGLPTVAWTLLGAFLLLAGGAATIIYRQRSRDGKVVEAPLPMRATNPS